MKKNLLFFSLIFIPGIFTAFAQTPVIEWQKSLGGSDDDVAYSIQQTTDGGYIVAGLSFSTDKDISSVSVFSNFWVVKLDTSGVIEWERSMGDIGVDYVTYIRQTSDGGFITAGVISNRNVWIIKLDKNGNMQWDKYFSENMFKMEEIHQTTDGGYIMAGSGRDSESSGSFSDYYIVKLNDTGAIEWHKSYGGTNRDEAMSIQQTKDEGYIVAGYAYSKDGDVTDNHGNADYWILKLDNTGILQWQRTFGGTAEDIATSIQQTKDDGYIVAGHTLSNNADISGHYGEADYWVVKLDNDGTIQWEKSFGGTDAEFAKDIKQTTDGGYIVAGYTKSNDGDVVGNQGNNDYWLVKLDGNGTLQWQKCMGGTTIDIANTVQQTADGGYVVAGFSSSRDGDISENLGRADFWIVKLTLTQADTTEVGITKKILGETLHIYPNPVDKRMVVGNIPEGSLLSIVNMTGKIVYQLPAAGEKEINTENLPNGIYCVRIVNSGNAVSKKIVINR